MSYEKGQVDGEELSYLKKILAKSVIEIVANYTKFTTTSFAVRYHLQCLLLMALN